MRSEKSCTHVTVKAAHPRSCPPDTPSSRACNNPGTAVSRRTPRIRGAPGSPPCQDIHGLEARASSSCRPRRRSRQPLMVDSFPTLLATGEEELDYSHCSEEGHDLTIPDVLDHRVDHQDDNILQTR